MRIAILGTFDLQNYGDLLFPLLAEQELGWRLEHLEILPFSYRSKKTSEWPYRVHPIGDLPRHLPDLDALVVGGGHLVRFDEDVAPEYGPEHPEIHHPTGLWLIPPFLAAAAGLPVVWNAVGASPELQDWALPLFRSTLESSAYVSVRDRASRATLRTVADQVEVCVVPDSAFGIPELIRDPKLEESYQQWREVQGLDGPYVVVQGSPKLEPVLGALTQELDRLASQGIRTVELPIGPVLGDRTGWIAPHRDDVVRVDPWPHPLLLAHILVHAEAAVGVSLHLGITSLSHGVPVHRPRCWPGSKYEILGDFPHVYQFDENGRPPRPHLLDRTGRSRVSSEVRTQQKRLAQHWDRVAEAIQACPGSQRSVVGRFFFRLPFDLIQGRAAQLTAEKRRAQVAEERKLRHEAEEQRDAAVSHVTEAAERFEHLRHSQAETAGRLTQTEGELKRERARRQNLERQRERLEQHLGELSSRIAEIASLQRKSEEARAGLQEALQDIYRSRAWRTSIFLRMVYLALARPWRRFTSLFARVRKPTDSDLD